MLLNIKYYFEENKIVTLKNYIKILYIYNISDIVYRYNIRLTI
jgi:hypothetical protein